jgi:hypothetical protein
MRSVNEELVSEAVKITTLGPEDGDQIVAAELCS